MSISHRELKRAKVKSLLKDEIECISCKYLKWEERSDHGYHTCVCEHNKIRYHKISDTKAVWCQMWNDKYSGPGPGITYIKDGYRRSNN